jgi:hypothetical protein
METVYQTAQRHVPQDSSLHRHWSESFKPYIHPKIIPPFLSSFSKWTFPKRLSLERLYLFPISSNAAACLVILASYNISVLTTAGYLYKAQKSYTGYPERLTNFTLHKEERVPTYWFQLVGVFWRLTSP